MRHKVSELEGALLDAAVAKAEGMRLMTIESYEHVCMVEVPWPQGVQPFEPSTDWDQGGPIIERERISVMREAGDDFWTATTYFLFQGGIDGPSGYGPTPLIAAMRAYVASKLGEEVELP